MKNIYLILAFVLPISLFSQSFNSGSFEINVGTGAGIYGAKDNEPVADTSDNSIAVAGLINLSFKYYINKNIGIGFILERNGFVHDSTNKAHSLNIALNAQYLIINNKKNVIFFDLFGGFSNFKYINSKDKNWVTSNGMSIQPGVGFKHLFGDNFGFYIQSNYAYYKYNKIIDKDSNVLKTSDSKDYKIRIAGLNLKFGVLIKF